MVYLKSVENVITLDKLIGLLFLFCLPLLSILFLKTKRNDLARPVMGTIFLVIHQVMMEKYFSFNQNEKCPDLYDEEILAVARNALQISGNDHKNQ